MAEADDWTDRLYVGGVPIAASVLWCGGQGKLRLEGGGSALRTEAAGLRLTRRLIFYRSETPSTAGRPSLSFCAQHGAWGLSAMIYQLVDANNERLRLWTGSAAGALRERADLGRRGRSITVADHKGRRLSASDLYECAARENERQATASLASFKRLMEARGA